MSASPPPPGAHESGATDIDAPSSDASSSDTPSSDAPTLVAHASAQALRNALCVELRADRERLRGDARGLLTPRVVLVTSAIARAYWLGAFAADVGACAGLRVQTLWSAALELLEPEGDASTADDALFDALVGDAASREPELAADLGAYDDALSLAAASASDLLSAGLVHTGALENVRGVSSRTYALARAALAARAAATRARVSRHGDVYARAAERLELGRGDARNVWIVGVPDATGQLARLLDALRARGARMHVLQVALEHGAVDTRITHHAARALELEWDEVALGLRAELERGCAPERLAIITRASPHAQAVARSALALHGVPLQRGEVDGAQSPRGRRALARLELAAQGEQAPIDAWLDALDAAHELDPVREDVRLALAAQGCARLGDLARLDLTALPHDSSLALPARGAVGDDADEVDDGAADDGAADTQADVARATRPRRRTLAARHVHTARRCALELCAHAATAPQRARATAWRTWLAAWDAACGGASLEPAWLALPEELELSAHDYRALVARRVRAACATPLLGAGSGVWWLSPEQAHGASFDVVFAPGLLRGAFPRGGSEDPLLSDAERARVRAALPALALKSARAHEERRLWSELLRCAPRVHVSHCTRDADGRPLAPAPYLRAELRARARADAAAVDAAPNTRPSDESSGAPSRVQRLATDDTSMRASDATTETPVHANRSERALPARRHVRALSAVRARAALDETTLAFAFASASAEARELYALDAPAGAEAARGRAQSELEHDAPPWRGLGPQHGWVAALSTQARFATFYENVARCGWQALLARELGLEQRLDPLGVLPRLDALLLGTTVHAALERLLAPRTDVRATLDARLERDPWRVARPSSAQVDAALLDAATRALLERGVRYRGLVAALAELARPRVARALELTFEAAEIWTYGVELDGRCALGGLDVRFRADRVDACADGPRLYDYKVGRPSASRKQFERAIRRGALLQAACYAACADYATGRYVYLHPDEPASSAQLDTAALEDGGRAAAAAALGVLARALERGVLAPRPFVDNRLNQACDSCAVASACSRLDSGWRARFEHALAHAREHADARTQPRELALEFERLDALARAELGA